MNAPQVARLDRLQAALPWLIAAILPLAFYFKAYDPGLIKDITLQAAAWLALGAWLARALEAGRFEVPAPRAAVAAVAAAHKTARAAGESSVPNAAPPKAPFHGRGSTPSRWSRA